MKNVDVRRERGDDVFFFFFLNEGESYFEGRKEEGGKFRTPRRKRRMKYLNGGKVPNRLDFVLVVLGSNGVAVFVPEGPLVCKLEFDAFFSLGSGLRHRRSSWD